jgi:DNA polymerase-4
LDFGICLGFVIRLLGFKEMYLCADLDAFFVSVEQTLNPSLCGKPVVVGGLPHERGVVASASYEARRSGIHSGMPLARAYRLCPGTIFLKGNYNHYACYSKRFYEILNLYSPEVEMASIDEAYVNIKGTERLFGPPQILAGKLKTDIRKRLGIPVSIGIARTRVLSKIVCGESKPDGLLVLSPPEELNFLSPLAVNVLPGIGPKALGILKNLNINTIAELLSTSDWVLETALGNYHRIIKFILSGGDFESHDGIKSVSRETTLPEDTMNQELIYALLRYLVERGCSTLRKNGLTARTLTVKVRFSDFKTISRRTGISATHASQTIFEHGAGLMKGLLNEKKRVRLIGIALAGLGYDGMQPSIFTAREERIDQFNHALDWVREKFGFNSLFPANAIVMKEHFRENGDGYTLHTPSLSR